MSTFKARPIEPGALVMIIADHPQTVKAVGKNIGVTCTVVRRVVWDEYLPEVHRHPCNYMKIRPLAAFDSWLLYGRVWYPPINDYAEGYILRDTPQLMRIDGHEEPGQASGLSKDRSTDKIKEKETEQC